MAVSSDGPYLRVDVDPGWGSRSEAAKITGATLRIVRDWVPRFNEGGLTLWARARRAAGLRS